MTVRSSRSSADGFTLIEVLIALVILAVGLLGLTALGVNAVYSVGLGERNTRANVLATQYVEEALELLRGGEVPEQLCEQLSNGDVVSRTIVLSASNPIPRLARVTVRVTPEPRGKAPHPFEVTAHYFDADGYSGSVSGTPCT